MSLIKRRADIDIEHGETRININIALESSSIVDILEEIQKEIAIHLKEGYKLVSIYFYEENIK